jgi:hypothetical protein
MVTYDPMTRFSDTFKLLTVIIVGKHPPSLTGNAGTANQENGQRIVITSMAYFVARSLQLVIMAQSRAQDICTKALIARNGRMIVERLSGPCVTCLPAYTKGLGNHNQVSRL